MMDGTTYVNKKNHYMQDNIMSQLNMLNEEATKNMQSQNKGLRNTTPYKHDEARDVGRSRCFDNR